MSSIKTNAAAMTALQSLTQTNKMLTQTQGHISTGLRVAEASDNAAYWSIATTMKSDKASLSTVQDALGLGASMVDVSYTAMSSAIDVVNQIKSKLVAAREPGVDKTKIQTEITQLQKQLKGIADSASFSGAELRYLSDSSAAGFSPTRSVVSSFNRTGNSVAVQTIDIDTSGMDLFDANPAATDAGCGYSRRQPHSSRRCRQHGHNLVHCQPRHLDADGQCSRRDEAEQLYQRRRFGQSRR